MQENRRQAEEKDREELMQRVTTDDEFRLLVNQYDAKLEPKVRKLLCTSEKKTYLCLSCSLTRLKLFVSSSVSIQRSGGMVDDLLSRGKRVECTR